MSATAETAPAPAGAPSPALREIGGPSAFGGEGRRFFQLLWLSAATDFKLRYRGSLLGYGWTLLRPLALFGILYLVFTRVIRFGGAVPDYAVLLLMNIVLFSFFSDATTAAVSSLASRESTVRRTQFPRVVIPFAVVLTGLLTFGLNMVAVSAFLLISGVTPTWSWLLFPLIALALTVLISGTSLLLSVANLRVRDTPQVWAVFSRALFYATPILYPVEFAIDAGLRPLLIVNPLAPIVAQARVWLIQPDAPNAVEMAGGWGWLAVTAAIAIGTCALGLWAFTREARRVAEYL
jgi:ABC-2 type transport system permease protein